VGEDADHTLVAQLLDDVGGENGEWFLQLLDGVEREGITQRQFGFNTTDVIVDFIEGWVDIVDILYGDTDPHRVELGWLRERVARSSSTAWPHAGSADSVARLRPLGM
jgi:hypothetical protein